MGAGLVSIVIPTVNAKIFKKCIDSVVGYTKSNYELVIVCDTPNEDKRTLLKEIKAKIVINESRVGVPKALNQGLEAATGDYIMLMNDDIIIQTEDWLAPLVRTLKEHPEFGIVCPRVIHPDCDEKNFFAAIGECSLISRELLNKIGRFDESEEFSLLCSDGDYYMRCKQEGYKIVGINDISVKHLIAQTIRPELTEEKLQAPMRILTGRYGNAIKVDQHRHLVYSVAEDKIILKGEMLELGGGNNPQFHPNIDVRSGYGVDIVANLEERLPIEDESYSGVWCQYTLEHISWRKVRDFIKEIYRILKPNGKLTVITANLKEQAKVLANSPKWEGDYESRLIFGDQDYADNTHKFGLSPEYAERLFSEVGFQVKVEPHPNCLTDMVIQAEKGVPMIDRFTWIKDKIKELNPETILDIGCSDCPITYGMTNCTWVDSSPYEKIVTDMRPFGRTPIPKDKYYQTSAEDLPFENKSFDLALATELLEHASNPVKALDEIKRVAKNVIITVPNEYEWDEKWKPFTNIGHVRHYTEQMLKQHLKEAKINKYSLEKLSYDGWAFYTIVANLGDISLVKKVIKPNTTLNVYNEIHNSALPTTLTNDHLKIALLSTPFLTVPPRNYGGLERIVYDTSYCLAKLGHDVTVFAPDGSKVEGCKMEYFGPAIEKTDVNWLDAERNAANIVIDRIINNDYQILHGHNWFGMEYAIKVRKPDLKTCHTHHGGLNLDWWGSSKPPFALNLIAISNWMQSVYSQQGFTSRVVYNGIPLEEYGYKAEKGDRLCYDRNTEVLTLDGFKPFSEVTLKDSVATLNPSSNRIEYMNPIDTQKFYYNGKMVHFHGNSYNLLVTPEHKVYCEFGYHGKKDSRKWRLITALELYQQWKYGRFRIRRSGKWLGEELEYFILPSVKNKEHRFLGSFPGLGLGRRYKAETTEKIIPEKKIPIEIWLRFFGWWITEGYAKENANGHYSVVLRQTNLENSNEIESIIAELGYNYYKSIGKDGCNSFEINNKQLCSYLTQFGNSKDRRIPSHIKKLSPKYLRILMDTMLLGDGSQEEGKTSSFTTSSRKLADDFQEILLKVGLPGSIYTYDKGKTLPQYVITISGCVPDPTICNKPELVEYEGPVFDITVPNNHIIFVRRNGKAVWSSNCFVGRLDSFKRPHIAIEVAKQVGLGLDIVGGSFVNDIPYMEQVKQACDGKNIKLYLDASHTEKIALMQSAKAVIFPSLMGEPFGLITPEANACGTPVIGSRDGAIPEILQDGVSGFICDTVDEMVSAVKKIDSIRPEDCRKNAERFSREISAVNYVEAYRNIISGAEW